MELSNVYMVTGSLDNRLVLVRFNRSCQLNIYRDIAITAQMSHLKNVLRLGNINRKSLLSWGNRLRISNKVASAIIFLHTEFTTPIIHKDLKPHKVIIDEKSGVAKIVDFSFSISLPPGELELLTGKEVCGSVESDDDVMDRADSKNSKKITLCIGWILQFQKKQ
ncbi:hypothetical protein KY290_028316 [Solanum tuberosum]|uniref:Protein kinase domain-containing protein n=1 Tax=Solanum tuberosum TaxID=4113 RepID=A0ABQ7UHJ2_SOLTU|nr:hypothetical protein KY290_028316 [Solanum tuberosum]